MKSRGNTVYNIISNKSEVATHPCGPNFGALSHASPLKKDSKFEYEGKLLTLPQHGFLRECEWRVIDKVEDEVVLELNHDGNIKEDPQVPYRYSSNYPFHFIFRLKLKLQGNNLDYRLSFKNLGPKNAFVDLASHNYHLFTPGMSVLGLSGLRYVDETTAELDTKQLIFTNNLRTVERDWHVELLHRNFFEIVYPNRDVINLTMVKEDESDIEPKELVLWTKPSEGDFICVEPVLRGRNSINNQSAIMVEPGFEAALHFRLSMVPGQPS